MKESDNLPASMRSRARELLIPAYGVSPFENISIYNAKDKEHD